MDLLDAARPFYKGNLHCHSTLSDGALTPRKVKAFYRERGYDFLAVTDHRLLGEETHMEDGLLVLSGLEMGQKCRFPARILKSHNPHL